MPYRPVYQEARATIYRNVTAISPLWRVAIAMSVLAIVLWWGVQAVLLNSSLGDLLGEPSYSSSSSGLYSGNASAHSVASPVLGAAHLEGADLYRSGSIASGAAVASVGGRASAARNDQVTQANDDSLAATEGALAATDGAELEHSGAQALDSPSHENTAAAQEAQPDRELAADVAARKMKEALGLQQSKPLTRAVDVQMIDTANCDVPANILAPVSVQFRRDSYIPRATSMRELERLAEAHQGCPSAHFSISENPLGKVDATEALTQRRFDEVKYYFLQNSVPKAALRYVVTP